MKKVLIVLFLLFSFATVKAESNDSEVKVNWISGVYYRYWYNAEIHWGQMGYIYANGVISYCIDIDNVISTGIYSSTDNITVNSDIPLYSYFGYGYLNNNTLEDYLATQKLIWESLGIKIKYTTASGGNGNLIDVSSNQNKILNYISEYNKVPNFDNSFNFYVGENNVINDKNNVINNYYVVNDSKNSFGIYDNNLLINSNISGANDFYLKTNYINRGENRIYYANNSQSLIQIGNINNKEYKYNYNVTGGTLSIKLYDNITQSNINSGLSTFKGNVFNLYDSEDNLVGRYETDEDGKIYIENLNKDKYRLEHTTISEGYDKQLDEYNFEIIANDINKSIDIYLNPKQINFKIKKTYSNPYLNNIKYDENITFDIYNSKNELVDEITTDDNGEANINLVYDSYIIMQKNINEGIKKTNNYFIDNNNFNSNILYEAYTPVLTSKLKLYLYEKGTTIPIPNSKFLIDNKEYITNEDGIIITDYLKEGNYNILQESKSGYVNFNNIDFEINEDSDFYLYDDVSFLDLFLYNEKYIEPVKEIIGNQEKEESIDQDNYIKNNDYNIKVLPNLYTKFFIINNSLYYV